MSDSINLPNCKANPRVQDIAAALANGMAMVNSFYDTVEVSTVTLSRGLFNRFGRDKKFRRSYNTKGAQYTLKVESI